MDNNKKYAWMIIAIVAIVFVFSFAINMKSNKPDIVEVVVDTKSNIGGKAIQANLKAPCTMVWPNGVTKPYSLVDECLSKGDNRIYLGNYEVADSCLTNTECLSYSGKGICVQDLIEVCS